MPGSEFQCHLQHASRLQWFGQPHEHEMQPARLQGHHAGRQLDAAPHPLDQLPHIRVAVGDKLPLIVDSGIRSGLDVAKAIASGADFVLLGRAFMYAVAALGNRGGEHAAAILFEELRDVMAQLGVATIGELSGVPVTRMNG